MKKRGSLAYLILCGGIFALDQGLKYKAKNSVPAGRSRQVSEKLVFQNSKNYGACLNLGEKHPEAVKNTAAILTAASAAGLIASLGKKNGKKSLRLGLSMLTGGALSNLADRYRDGYVTDYVSFPKAPGKMKHWWQ